MRLAVGNITYNLLHSRSLCTLSHISLPDNLLIDLERRKPAINSPWKAKQSEENILIYFPIYKSFPSSFPGRYYRANSVRFPTQPCEGICSLNHYCAITRIDYREYRQCLETATSALASTTRSISGGMNNKILLLLIAFIHILVHHQFVLTQAFVSATYVQLCIVKRIKGFVEIMNYHSQQVC